MFLKKMFVQARIVLSVKSRLDVRSTKILECSPTARMHPSEPHSTQRSEIRPA